MLFTLEFFIQNISSKELLEKFIEFLIDKNEIKFTQYDSSKENKKTLLSLEEKICDYFGWENCISSFILPSSDSSIYYLNDGFHVGTLYKNFKFLDHVKSEYQDIRVYETELMGKILVLDGCVQMTDELDDNYTIDMISFLNKTKEYENILILGGGDLIIPSYLLENYKNIRHVTVCEIDKKVVEIVRKHFRFSDKLEEEEKNGRFDIFFEDGAIFIKKKIEENKKYDGIIIDCTDVDLDDCIAASLFTVEFYKNIKKLLNYGCYFSQQVSDLNSKNKFELMIKGAEFNNYNFIYSETPEYSVSIPLGIVKND